MKKFNKSTLIWSILVTIWNIGTACKLINNSFNFTIFNVLMDLILGPLMLIYHMFLLKHTAEKN